MSSDTWRTFILGELGYFKNGINFSRDDFESGYEIVNVKNLYDGRYASLTELDSIKKEIIKSDEYFLKTNDILFARSSVKASGAGQVAIVPEIPEKKYVYSGFIIRFRITENVLVEHHYLNYLLRSPQFREYFVRIAVGTTITNLSQRTLSDVEIPLPSIETQRRIADILSALDDKIELNRQTNATLEAIAQAVFREWFVNFNFPGATGEMQASELGPIPVGWRIGKVGELCEVNNNSILKNDQFEWIDYIEISQVSKGKIANVTRYLFGEEPSRARRKLKHGDTVLSTVRPNRGSYFLALNPAETSIASTGFAVFSPTKVPFGFLYLLLTDSEKLEYYGHVADGAAYPAINPKLIMEMEIVIPEDCVLNDFHSITEPIFYKMFFADQETETLAQMRDTLLPKLMRGEIEV
ncbi:MAG: hypothetical protein FOGNACKC_06300 [Anaerolineae bacterium]|nr:hypothetical protein [Anaerolineae bacterium]